MNAKNNRTWLPVLTFLSVCGISAHAHAQEGAEVDKGLAPLIMVVFDTSTSMDTVVSRSINPVTGLLVNADTRLTKAISEIAGNPRRVEAQPLRTLSGVRFSRRFRECDSESCRYISKLFCVGTQAVDGKPCETVPVTGTTYRIHNLDQTLYNPDDPATYGNAYHDDGVLQAYQYSVKFGFAGMAYPSMSFTGLTSPSLPNPRLSLIYGNEQYRPFDEGEEVQGVVINDDYKTRNNNTRSAPLGMWSAHPQAPAPLLYPIVSDEQDDIYQSNLAVIDGVRSYYPTSSTPIGPVLADMYYMFGDPYKGVPPDRGLIEQYVRNINDFKPDSSFACRPKAIIFVTDGEPCCGEGYTGTDTSQRGHAYNVWHDAYHLYKTGVKVYVVGYAFSNLSGKSGVGSTMNKMAWKGGTCRSKGTFGEIIDPDSQADYDTFVNKETTAQKSFCFFNAEDSTALRQALVTVLSDMLSGRVSKSKMTTTSAIGTIANYNDEHKVVNGGWYNVYSGYQITLGHIRHTDLQRETFVCNSEKGRFENDASQYLDITARLKERIAGCALSGTCLSNRAIYVGDYSEDSFAIGAELLPISDTNAGRMRYADVDGKHQEYSFFESNPRVDTCESFMKEKIVNYTSVVQNYMLSPYECAVDFDCGLEDKIPRYCDAGRCLNLSAVQDLRSCSRPSDMSEEAYEEEYGEEYEKDKAQCLTGSTCLGGKCRPLGGMCRSHADCSADRVCHHGHCELGIVKSCDVRPFMASLPLGTIEYATPLVVEPPRRAYRSREYVDFTLAHASRDTMLYVAANDAMLHGFVLGQHKADKDYQPHPKYTGPTAIEEGDERWAFVPKAVLPNLHKLIEFGTQTHVNASPVAADVKFPDGVWRTVLVGGFREGGRGYYALDITDPREPKILWEIDHMWRPEATASLSDVFTDIRVSVDAEDKSGENLARMGWSYPEPVITNIVIKDKIEPVVILAGGESFKSSEDDLTGRALYILRLAPKTKDELIVRVIHYDTAITGTPSVYPSGFNSIARLVYFGDENGALHRLDLSNRDPNKWVPHRVGSKITPIFDPSSVEILNKFTYDKITYKPAVSPLNGNANPDIQITFGTGSSSTTSIGDSDVQYVASFVDYYHHDKGYQLNVAPNEPLYEPKLILFNSDVADPKKDITFGDAAFELYTTDPVSKGELIRRQKMMGAAVTYNFESYFPTFNAASANSACTSGYASIWRLNVTKDLAKERLKTVSSGVQNENTADTAFGSKSFYDLSPGTMVYGVAITQQAYCIRGDIASSMGSMTAPQLVAQTNSEVANISSGGASDGSNLLRPSQTDVKTMALNLDAINPSVRVVSWASVYE